MMNNIVDLRNQSNSKQVKDKIIAESMKNGGDGLEGKSIYEMIRVK